MNIGKSDTFRRRLLLVWATEDMDVFLFCFKCSLNVQKQMSNVHGCQRWSGAFKVELLRSYGVKPNHVNVHIWTAVRPELKSRLQGYTLLFPLTDVGSWTWWLRLVMPDCWSFWRRGFWLVTWPRFTPCKSCCCQWTISDLCQSWLN